MGSKRSNFKSIFSKNIQDEPKKMNFQEAVQAIKLTKRDLFALEQTFTHNGQAEKRKNEAVHRKSCDFTRKDDRHESDDNNFNSTIDTLPLSVIYGKENFPSRFGLLPPTSSRCNRKPPKTEPVVKTKDGRSKAELIAEFDHRRDANPQNTLEIATEKEEDLVNSIQYEKAMRERLVRRHFERMKREEEEREAKEAVIEKVKLERDNLVGNIVKNIETRIVSAVVEQDVFEIIRSENEKRTVNLAKELTERFWSQNITQVVDDMVRTNVATILHEHQEHQAKIEEGMRNVRRNLHLAWLRQFANRWMFWTEEKKKRRMLRTHQLRRIVPTTGTQDIAKYISGDVSKGNPVDMFIRKDIRVAHIVRNRKLRNARKAFSIWKKFTDRRKYRRHFNVVFDDENLLSAYIENDVITNTYFKFERPQKATLRFVVTESVEGRVSDGEDRGNKNRIHVTNSEADESVDKADQQQQPNPETAPTLLPQSEVFRNEVENIKKELESRRSTMSELSQSADQLMDEILDFGQKLQTMESDLLKTK